MVLGQPIRNLLTYTGVEWEDKTYEISPPDGPGRQAWENDKNDGLGLDFPNLPYYIDGDVKLSQSLSIIRHLGRKHGLYGQTEEEQCRQDMAEQQHVDLKMAMIRAVYFQFVCALRDLPTPESKAEYLEGALPTHLKLFTKFIGDRNWLLGDRLTYVDFLWYEVLDWQLYLDPECFKDFPVVRDFIERFENLPKIKEYLKSDKFQKWPLFGSMALWGHKEEGMKLRFPDG
ncbi:unnamed protein product [Darwinula stevensoni]|uniref:glutathione transferase n=2 Tax=Darwinula stevensoni TaxID=69355 RepID=A0A7R9A5D5_9CRUS|nr:unnamed protein product [Darwinula stevensoni]CAG0894171.1 unnamed protein product [Darwinula stevensoni]